MTAIPKLLIACFAQSGARIRQRRLWGDQSGAAAVDFALVLAPFLAVLMAVMQSALTLFANQVLQTATTNAGRLIMTGQAQNGGWNAAQFQTMVCANLTVIFNCASNLNIDVRSFSSFNSVSLPSATNTNGTLANNYVFQPGNPGDVVVVRLIYQLPIIGTGLGIGIANSAGNTYTLIAAAAFRNEPY